MYRANNVTLEMIEKVKEMASDPYREYEYIGIRIQDDIPFKLGKMSHNSHIWNDGDDTGEELPGICVIDGHKAHLITSYYGNHAAIICGDHAEYGEDKGELIISDPIVITILF